MSALAYKNARVVRSGWLEKGGRRLDCNPYMSGALEARDTLRTLKARKEPLKSLTVGYAGGIYNGPMFRRNYVDSPERGVPFISSGSMLMADLRALPLLRRKDAESTRLSYLRLKPGMTMISCSGTIGRMCYVRADMDGIWSSQDVLKVVADPTRIPPGYLYSFLSSRYGVPLVVSGTYGAIIQHIESEHIQGLEVPRFNQSDEQRIHDKIEQAADLRGRANKSLAEVASEFEELFPDIDLRSQSELTVSSISAGEVQARLDAQFHNPRTVQIRSALRSVPHTSIGAWCDNVFLPGIFKRVHVEGPGHAAPYYTGYSLYWNEPEPKGYLSKATKLFSQVRLRAGMILVQAFGQEGGLTGRPVWVGRHLDGSTTTHMLVRLIVRDRERAGYLFGFLSSLLAYRQISCLTYGGSIPHFDVASIKTVLIPRRSAEREALIGRKVLQAMSDRDEALQLEMDARSDVESLINGVD